MYMFELSNRLLLLLASFAYVSFAIRILPQQTYIEYAESTIDSNNNFSSYFSANKQHELLIMYFVVNVIQVLRKN